ncbi:secreted RxLR effector protein 161-like [Primulina tabacum]|uniref:secreted RxLR effector protein 161-like n=1 Tax=Primulina tabacum TaxID=48773 RepID=UPI003F598849
MLRVDIRRSRSIALASVNEILKYLRRINNLFLVYGGGKLKFERYSDSSFQSDVDDSKSTSGFVFKLNDCVFFEKSSKQDTTTDSTIEAKYIAASAVAKEATWMRNFAQKLDVIPQTVDPVLVYSDNISAIAQAKELRSHQ